MILSKIHRRISIVNFLSSFPFPMLFSLFVFVISFRWSVFYLLLYDLSCMCCTTNYDISICNYFILLQHIISLCFNIWMDSVHHLLTPVSNLSVTPSVFSVSVSLTTLSSSFMIFESAVGLISIYKYILFHKT